MDLFYGAEERLDIIFDNERNVVLDTPMIFVL